MGWSHLEPQSVTMVMFWGPKRDQPRLCLLLAGPNRAGPPRRTQRSMPETIPKPTPHRDPPLPHWEIHLADLHPAPTPVAGLGPI